MPEPVEAAPGIAALHIAPEALALGVEPPLMGVAGSAVLVRAHEHGVVVFFRPVPGFLAALIDHPTLCEGVEDVPVDEPLLEQISVKTPHSTVGRRESEFLSLLRLRRLCLGVGDPLTVQQALHRLLVRKAVIRLDKGDGAAALLRLMIVPLIAPHGDAVVGGQALVPAGGDESLSLPAQELHQIHIVGTEFLLISEWNVRHSSPPK